MTFSAKILLRTCLAKAFRVCSPALTHLARRARALSRQVALRHFFQVEILKEKSPFTKHLLKLALVFLALSASALADKPSSLFETANPLVPELPQIRLTVGTKPLDVEVASSPGTMARGLMYRTSLAADKGMLFVFPTDHQASFWMKNTSIPLSLAYIDKQGKILEILSLIPFEETPVKSKTDRVRYALEVNRDWFNVHNIKAGTLIQNLPQLKPAP